jgi:hypothetical protein
MNLRILVASLLIIGRTYLFIKVISWLILNLFTQTTHPLDEIQIHLIFILLDVWIFGQSIPIFIGQEKED